MDLIRPSIVLFGDSLTQHSFANNGWGAKLADEYATTMDVFNRGFSGYNTRWAQFIYKDCINTRVFQQLEVVVLFFGANDCVLPNLIDRFSRQHVPVDEYRQHLDEMIEYFAALSNRDSSTPRVIVVGPPAVDEAAWHKEMLLKWSEQRDPATIPCNRTLAVAKQYNDAAKAAAQAACKTRGVPRRALRSTPCLAAPFVDLMGAMLAQSDDAWKALLSDGLHLNSDGSELLHRLLRTTLDAFPRGALKIDGMRAQFPHHHDIDENNPRDQLRSCVPGSWLKP